MSKETDGGPAFPSLTTEAVWAPAGMSLRDYIAIHAPSAEVSDFRYNDTGARVRGWAAARYLYADCMLRVREMSDE